MKKYTSQKNKEFVSKPSFDEKVILSKDANYPKVSAVIPIHNRIRYTLRFLESFEKVDYPNYEIIIIDDGSTDGSWEAISKHYPKVRLIRGDGTLWWSGATNMGIKDAVYRGTDYILTINNDVEVDPNFLKALVECAEENPRSIIGSMVYCKGEPTKLWFAGGTLGWKKGKSIVMIGYGEYDRGQYEGRREVEAITGMGVLIKAKYFEEIGLYDRKNFPQYHADYDFTMRARKKGYRLIIDSKSKIYNNVKSRSMKKLVTGLFSIKSACNIRDNWRYYRRYCPRKYLITDFLLWCARYVSLFFPNKLRRWLKNLLNY